jgi:hypothetical protein
MPRLFQAICFLLLVETMLVGPLLWRSVLVSGKLPVDDPLSDHNVRCCFWFSWQGAYPYLRTGDHSHDL